jgi:hypothetical protein
MRRFRGKEAFFLLLSKNIHARDEYFFGSIIIPAEGVRGGENILEFPAG